MNIPFSGVTILLSGLFLSYFATRRFVDFKKNPENITNNYYLLASGLVSLAMIIYGIPSFFYESRPYLLSLGATFATILNIAGFGYFLRIPLYIWLPPKKFSLASHITSLYILVTASLLIASPPPSLLDANSIIHWKFSLSQSLFIIFLNALAFVLNIIVLSNNFKMSHNLNGFLKLAAIIITFILTGLGGGYLYFGDNSFLLKIANIFLLAGILAVVVGSYSLREPRGEKERTDI